MRLYSIQYHVEDGRLRNCRQIKTDHGGCLPSLKRKITGMVTGEPRSQQRCTFMHVMSAEDRVNVISLQTISRYVFCTPRCFITKSWEVGVCNTYQARYLCGGASPTSFDMHIIMVLECLQVYLQYNEIRDQTVGYFYLPDELLEINWVPEFKTDVPALCQPLWQLIQSMQSYSHRDGHGMSITGMLAHLNLLRRTYFDDLHLDNNLKKKSAHRTFLKLLGFIYGRLISVLQRKNIILRQYYGNCPFQQQVPSII